jgi:hypothetical protein
VNVKPAGGATARVSCVPKRSSHWSMPMRPIGRCYPAKLPTLSDSAPPPLRAGAQCCRARHRCGMASFHHRNERPLQRVRVASRAPSPLESTGLRRPNFRRGGIRCTTRSARSMSPSAARAMAPSWNPSWPAWHDSVVRSWLHAAGARAACAISPRPRGHVPAGRRRFAPLRARRVHPGTHWCRHTHGTHALNGRPGEFDAVTCPDDE